MRNVLANALRQRSVITGPPSGALRRYPFVRRLSSSALEDIDYVEIKRLLYRSKQRGWLELDLIIGKYVQKRVFSMTARDKAALIRILACENPDLFHWITGLEKVPPEYRQNHILEELHKFAQTEYLKESTS
eukprot:GHVU01221642.1.p3 GENE.GHVU01221642.1~~GHVU01221642.1.p3  ORF type:complete len:132 (-),score=17.54 GHVU01221642.1:1756-2151(-)